MPKNVDGIKKLSKEELEKSRKIVLDSIGEGKVPDKPKIDNKSEKIKSVDSVFSKKIIKKTKIPIKPTNFLKPHDEDDPEENIKEKDKSSSLVSKVNPFANEIIKKRIEESEEKNKQEKREQDKRKKEEEQKETEERKKEEKKRKEEQQRKAEERKRKKKEKKKEKIKRKKLRQKKLKALDRKLNQTLVQSLESFKKSYKIVLLILFLGFIFATMLYTALLIVVVERELDNKFLRGLSGYLSLPAYISQDGLIDYYTYIDTKNILSSKFSQAEELDRAVKTQIVESIISNNLLLKYNIQISLKKLSLIEIKNILLEEIMHDQTINQVGLARINKIKDLIKKEDDFIKIANRYGDSQDKITLSLPDDLNDFPHLSELKDIEIGEVSGVINDNSGYYIYRCFDKREDNLYLSYVYVKGKTLNDYIKERVGQYKLWSLVD